MIWWTGLAPWEFKAGSLSLLDFFKLLEMPLQLVGGEKGKTEIGSPAR
jgi:hypothetical protein